jgi:hypothetical protein
MLSELHELSLASSVIWFSQGIYTLGSCGKGIPISPQPQHLRSYNYCRILL